MRYFGILVIQLLDHYTTLSSIPILFSFLVPVFRYPRDHITCVWPDDDWYRNTEWALRVSLHRRRSKSQSRTIKSLDILFRSTWKTAVMITQLRVTFDSPKVRRPVRRYLIFSWSKDLSIYKHMHDKLINEATTRSQSVSYKWVYPTPLFFQQCAPIVCQHPCYFNNALWSGKHDHQANTWASPRG